MSALNTIKNIIEDYLEQFYYENDPEMLKNEFAISGLAQFTIENGINSLNKLLFNKYGKKIDFGTNELTELIPISTGTEVVPKRKAFHFDVDKEMLRAELKVFYTQMKLVKQLSVLEDVIQWTCEFGIEKLDKKFE